jgi:hypothetical protein
MADNSQVEANLSIPFYAVVIFCSGMGFLLLILLIVLVAHCIWSRQRFNRMRQYYEEQLSSAKKHHTFADFATSFEDPLTQSKQAPKPTTKPMTPLPKIILPTKATAAPLGRSSSMSTSTTDSDLDSSIMPKKRDRFDTGLDTSFLKATISTQRKLEQSGDAESELQILSVTVVKPQEDPPSSSFFTTTDRTV